MGSSKLLAPGIALAVAIVSCRGGEATPLALEWGSPGLAQVIPGDTASSGDGDADADSAAAPGQFHECTSEAPADTMRADGGDSWGDGDVEKPCSLVIQ